MGNRREERCKEPAVYMWDLRELPGGRVIAIAAALDARWLMSFPREEGWKQGENSWALGRAGDGSGGQTAMNGSRGQRVLRCFGSSASPAQRHSGVGEQGEKLRIMTLPLLEAGMACVDIL